MRNWFEIRAAAQSGVGEVLIYGEIGPSFFGEETLSAKDFDAALKALGDASQIALRVNSPGGDVYDALAIFNMLKAHPARVTARVDGIAASAASLVVMAADEIVMPENSFLLIHEPQMAAFGDAADLLAAAADLETISSTFAAIYAKRSGMKEADVAALMAEDRLLDAAEAVSLGLADKAAQAVKIAANFSLAKLPKAARERFAAAMRSASSETMLCNERKKPMDAEPNAEGTGLTPETSMQAAPQASPAAAAAAPEAALADSLRAEYAEIAAVAAQAARLGVTVDAADAMRKGVASEALRRSVLDELAARAEASHVIAAGPSVHAAGDSPIVRRAKERAAAAHA